jgi:flagellin
MAVSGINSNIASLRVDRSLQKNTEELRKNFKQLSSGLRVNSASDDAAGLAIATELLANAKIDDVGSRNISDAVSAANIAEGALGSASDITSRLGELAAQASNGTLSASQRSALNNEFQALRSELDRISQTTEFNGLQLLGGSTSIGVQAGGGGSSGAAGAQLSLTLPGVSSASLGIATDISTQANAQAALDEARVAIENLAQARGQIGAEVARLDTAFENLRSASVNSRDAASRILDADFAEVSSRLASNKIQQQASVAVKAQANLQPANVLRLLS